MIKTEFHQPTGRVIENISITEMKKYILDEFEGYWRQGSGDGLINFFIDGANRYSMLIEPNEQYGIYLQYIDNETDEHWLSLFDENVLNEVVETADEIYASIGLFLPIVRAWDAIKEFLMTGKRSELITWVKPDIIPADGNW